MKAFSTTLPVALLALAPKVLALFQLEVEYSDLMVPVGDVNLFHAVWEVLYAQSDKFGGLSDQTYPAYTTKCGPHGADPDLSVTIQLDGQWGNVDNISGLTMRDALVQAAWKTVDALSKSTGYDVYTECWGTTWQEGIPYDNNAPCGAPKGPECPCDIGGAQCLKHSWGHKIPSKVKVQTYDSNGVLLPDNYVMTFSSSYSTEGGGCGRYGAIAEVLASFVPGVGPYFEKGIKIACRQ